MRRFLVVDSDHDGLHLSVRRGHHGREDEFADRPVGGPERSVPLGGGWGDSQGVILTLTPSFFTFQPFPLV